MGPEGSGAGLDIATRDAQCYMWASLLRGGGGACLETAARGMPGGSSRPFTWEGRQGAYKEGAALARVQKGALSRAASMRRSPCPAHRPGGLLELPCSRPFVFPVVAADRQRPTD